MTLSNITSLPHRRKSTLHPRSLITARIVAHLLMTLINWHILPTPRLMSLSARRKMALIYYQVIRWRMGIGTIIAKQSWIRFPMDIVSPSKIFHLHFIEETLEKEGWKKVVRWQIKKANNFSWIMTIIVGRGYSNRWRPMSWVKN